MEPTAGPLSQDRCGRQSHPPPFYNKTLILCLYPVPHYICGSLRCAFHVLPSLGPTVTLAIAIILSSRSAEHGDAPDAATTALLHALSSKHLSSPLHLFQASAVTCREGTVLQFTTGNTRLHTAQSSTTSWLSST